MSSTSLIASSAAAALSSSSRKMNSSVRFLDDDNDTTTTTTAATIVDTDQSIHNHKRFSSQRQSRSAWKSSSLIYPQSTQAPIVVHRQSSIIDLMVDEELEKKKKKMKEEEQLFIRPILKTKSHSLSPPRENLLSTQLRQQSMSLSAQQQDRRKHSQRSAWKSNSKSIAPPLLVERKETMTQAELIDAAKEMAQFDLECEEKKRSKKEFIDPHTHKNTS